MCTHTKRHTHGDMSTPPPCYYFSNSVVCDRKLCKNNEQYASLFVPIIARPLSLSLPPFHLLCQTVPGVYYIHPLLKLRWSGCLRGLEDVELFMCETFHTGDGLFGYMVKLLSCDISSPRHTFHNFVKNLGKLLTGFNKMAHIKACTEADVRPIYLHNGTWQCWLTWLQGRGGVARNAYHDICKIVTIFRYLFLSKHSLFDTEKGHLARCWPLVVHSQPSG